MAKFKGIGEAGVNFFPQAPQAKISMTRANIMKKDYTAGLDFGQPAPEIVTASFIGMQTIDVKQVYAFITELAQRGAEVGANEIGKSLVVLLVITANVVINFFTIFAGMAFSMPVVDGIARTAQSMVRYRLAEAKVRFSPMSSQLDEKLRLDCLD